ncbi:unnamed protein product [Acanthoscelides obtectus]|uniref:Uncharacterized protein n=1 Tax=Acanthoscelides obtectus TaxID=200917 RepID=A0A9P0MKV6_ACAOB|nr:unnamed protein product [Acanthoscelides obtectus]CAK1651449.1 hypothetical protein AOBTE_LOCUS17284 [Acanthoscelides obtectus]
MKGQKVTKSSKFTQVGPNDYHNVAGLTVLPASASISPSDDSARSEGRSVHYAPQHCHGIMDNSSEMLLQGSYEVYKTQESMHEIQRFSPEANANQQRPPSHQQASHQQDIELCNCIVPIYPLKTRFASDCKQQTELNRSYASLPKLMDVNQVS